MVHYFMIPFGVSGDLASIPENDVDGHVSYNLGWGPDYELNLLTNPDAIPVERDKTNQLMYDITLAIQQYQQFGTPDFISSADNGGSPFVYSIGARVRYDAGGGTQVYESLISSNEDLPSDTDSWEQVSDVAPALNFSALQSGTNTTATMVVGSGAVIEATGSGEINATSVPASGISGSTLPGGITDSSLQSVGTIDTGVWQGTPIVPAYAPGTVLAGAISGCLPTAMSGSHTTAAITVSSGQAADSTAAAYINSAGYSWAASNGNAINGTDAGSSTLANNETYHMFLCAGGSGVGTFCSASLTPTLPSGYNTYKRRIFSFNTDGAGAPIPFKALEVEGGALLAWLTTQVLDINTVSQSTSRIAYTLTVPTDIKIQPIIRVASPAHNVIFTSGDETDVVPGADYTSVPQYDQQGGEASPSDPYLTTNTSGQIGARSNSPSTEIYATTRGFKDWRRS